MAEVTDEDIVSTYLYHQQHGTKATAAHFGIAGRTVRGRIATARFRGLANTTLATVTDKLKYELNKLRVEVASLRSFKESSEEIRRNIYGLSDLNVEPPDWVLPKTNYKSGLSGVPMTIWSDWHWGEVVQPNQVGGVNEFNQAVAEARVQTLVKTTISLLHDYVKNPSYPGIVIALGGDMITGAIHEELAVTNWGTPMQQFVQVQASLEWALLQMADKFGKVFVPCVVGNHGRDTIKPRFKNRVFQNYEWNLYMQLARTFAKDKRFQFLIPEETDAYFKIYNHRFLLTHGDTLGVKGGDGIIGALGPIARGATKIGRAEAQIGRDFDTLILGHYHTYIPANDAVRTIVNGALKGYDEYARLQLRVPYSQPSQALWLVHPDHGITVQWQVFLDKKRHAGDNKEWLMFQQTKEI